MSDLMSIAQSGVRAYAKALDVVADNVANAATPGHVRRTTTLSPATLSGGQPPLELDPVGGSGVRLTSVGRAVDLLRAETVRRAESSVNALDATDRWLTAIQSALTGPNAVDAPMSELFGSLSDLANDPSNLAVRQTFLAKAQTLTDRFNGSAADLGRIEQDLALEGKTEVARLNGLSQGLADVNAQLRRSTSGSGASVALADQRDRILAQMSTIVAFNVRFDARGQASVRIPDAGGPMLVDGQTAQSARVLQTGFGLSLRIGPKGNDQAATLTGGTLAGLSAARVVLNQSRDRLDAMADRTASDFNRVHQEGVDFNGNDGGLLFSTRKPIITAAGANGGTARVSAEIADGADPAPMTLSFDGSVWTLEVDSFGPSISDALPLALDGLTVDTAGPARNGDVYRIRMGGGAAGIGLRPITPAEVSAASRWGADPLPTNLGSGRAELRMESALPLPATPPFAVSTLPGGILELTDGLGTVLATGFAGDWLAGDGFAIRIGGNPAEGDRFAIERTGPSDGGNGNSIALLALRDSGGPAGTFGEAQDRLITGVSVPLAETRAREDVARINRDTAAEALNESSGVDLNTEAAEMLRLQQAFQANARIIQTARETFDSILAATR